MCGEGLGSEQRARGLVGWLEVSTVLGLPGGLAFILTRVSSVL